MVWESFVERNLILHLEFNRECQGYLVQPFVIKWIADGIPLIYFGDCIAEIGGGLTVFECKHVHPNVYDVRATSKYDMVRDICRALGWAFRLITSGELSAIPARLLNHRDLLRHQFAEFSLAHELAVRDVLAKNGGVLVLGLLTEHLSRDFKITCERATAVVLAMTAAHMVHIDLTRRIDALSPVHLPPFGPRGMSLLNFWEGEKSNG